MCEHNNITLQVDDTTGIYLFRCDCGLFRYANRRFLIHSVLGQDACPGCGSRARYLDVHAGRVIVNCYHCSYPASKSISELASIAKKTSMNQRIDIDEYTELKRAGRSWRPLESEKECTPQHNVSADVEYMRKCIEKGLSSPKPYCVDNLTYVKAAEELNMPADQASTYGESPKAPVKDVDQMTRESILKLLMEYKLDGEHTVKDIIESYTQLLDQNERLLGLQKKSADLLEESVNQTKTLQAEKEALESERKRLEEQVEDLLKMLAVVDRPDRRKATIYRKDPKIRCDNGY